MNKVFKNLIRIVKLLLGVINVVLIIIIILNSLLILSSKVLKNEYPTILDYTYYVAKENVSDLSVNKDNLLIVDTRSSALENDTIIYQENNKYVFGKVSESDNYSATIKNNEANKKIDNENILGIVVLNIPEIGNIINKVLTIKSLIISIIILTISGLIENLLNKKIKKDNNSKPDFKNMQNI